MKTTLKLSINKHNFFLQIDQQPPVKVDISVLKPFVSLTKNIVFTNQKKEEILSLDNLCQTTPANQKIIRQAIQEKYFLPIITAIEQIDIAFGARYWTVTTDHGPVKFTMRTPSRHLNFVTTDRLIVKDSLGNFYLIPSLAKLPSSSQKQLQKIL